MDWTGMVREPRFGLFRGDYLGPGERHVHAAAELIQVFGHMCDRLDVTRVCIGQRPYVEKRRIST
jgi:hypothetical protein